MLLWGDCLRDLVHMLPLHRGSRYSDNTLKREPKINLKLIHESLWDNLNRSISEIIEQKIYLFYDSGKIVWTILRQEAVGPQWNYTHCPLCLSFRRFLNFRAKFLPGERIRIYAEMSITSSIFCCDLYYYLDPLREPICVDNICITINNFAILIMILFLPQQKMNIYL